MKSTLCRSRGIGSIAAMRTVLPFLGALALLAACDVARVPPAVPPVPVGEADTCGGAQYAGLVGQDATALERVLIIGQVRVIRPGTAVTMDFRPQRLNFEVGEDGRIARIYCG